MKFVRPYRFHITVAAALAFVALTAVGYAVGSETAGRGGQSATPAAGATPAAAQAGSTNYDPAILDVAGRTEDDHYRDGGFKPLEVYAFFGIEPGMTVVDLATSRMYNAHILSQIVGPEGKVIATSTYRTEGNTERTQGTLDERNVDGVLSNVQIVATLEDIPDASVDAIVTVRNYHDFGERDERVATLPRLMRVLKPGGILGAVDAHTDKTDGRDESVHRLNEELARQEIIEGGFEFVGSSDLLYNAEDTFDFDGREGLRTPDDPSDDAPINRYYIQRWTLKFRKPMQ